MSGLWARSSVRAFEEPSPAGTPPAPVETSEPHRFWLASICDKALVSLQMRSVRKLTQVFIALQGNRSIVGAQLRLLTYDAQAYLWNFLGAHIQCVEPQDNVPRTTSMMHAS